MLSLFIRCETPTSVWFSSSSGFQDDGGSGRNKKKSAKNIFQDIWTQRWKIKKSTLYKHILRWDKRAEYSKKKILLLYNFCDQMHVNAVALHLQHKWMPYPQFQQPLFYWITSQSFHLSLFTEPCWFLFQEKINRIFCDLSSFFGLLFLVLFPFLSCSEKFLLLFAFLTSSLPWIPASFVSPPWAAAHFALKFSLP